MSAAFSAPFLCARWIPQSSKLASLASTAMAVAAVKAPNLLPAAIGFSPARLSARSRIRPMMPDICAPPTVFSEALSAAFTRSRNAVGSPWASLLAFAVLRPVAHRGRAEELSCDGAERGLRAGSLDSISVMRSCT